MKRRLVRYLHAVLAVTVFGCGSIFGTDFAWDFEILPRGTASPDSIEVTTMRGAFQVRGFLWVPDCSTSSGKVEKHGQTFIVIARNRSDGARECTTGGHRDVFVVEVSEVDPGQYGLVIEDDRANGTRVLHASTLDVR